MLLPQVLAFVVGALWDLFAAAVGHSHLAFAKPDPSLPSVDEEPVFDEDMFVVVVVVQALLVVG